MLSMWLQMRNAKQTQYDQNTLFKKGNCTSGFGDVE